MLAANAQLAGRVADLERLVRTCLQGQILPDVSMAAALPVSSPSSPMATATPSPSPSGTATSRQVREYDRSCVQRLRFHSLTLGRRKMNTRIPDVIRWEEMTMTRLKQLLRSSCESEC
jgi:hypothetical protein